MTTFKLSCRQVPDAIVSIPQVSVYHKQTVSSQYVLHVWLVYSTIGETIGLLHYHHQFLMKEGIGVTGYAQACTR
jgi:hypothetical protein